MIIRRFGQWGCVLVAFDVDGTLDTSQGPVPWAWIERQRISMRDDGDPPIAVVVVSPSLMWPRDSPVIRFVDGDTRVENLRAAAAFFHEARLRLYVSDNGDWEAARAAGFVLVTPEDFIWGILPQEDLRSAAAAYPDPGRHL